MRAETSRQLGSNEIDSGLLRRIMSSVGNPRVSIRLWNGREYRATDERPVACLELRNRRVVFDLLRSPSIGFGEGYVHGLIDVQGDFLAFMNEITESVTRKNQNRYYLPRLRSMLYATRANSLTRARHNVHHHYDLGNDFYKLWLDKNMVYTCAYYADAAATLDEAQVAKMDHVCRKLRLQPGQRVIEAGCGWGSLAMHMAEHYGVSVVAFNTSDEQVAYARQQAAMRGLENRVEFVHDDYRTIDARCDVFVSVGMLEHVGLANFRTLGDVMRRSLKPDGIGLIHSIGRSHPNRMDPWITRRIFPGGHAPSLSEMMSVFEPQKFTVLDVENLRPHYARTCAAWLRNFEAAKETVADMYDEEFVRMWRLYLAGSSAGFQSGTLQLYQVLFAPPGNNRLPWSRAYQYTGETGAG